MVTLLTRNDALCTPTGRSCTDTRWCRALGKLNVLLIGKIGGHPLINMLQYIHKEVEYIECIY